MKSALFGFVIGAIGLAVPTLRTLSVVDGKPLTAFLCATMGSLTLVIFTRFVVAEDWTFVIANTLGAGLSVAGMAWWRGR